MISFASGLKNNAFNSQPFMIRDVCDISTVVYFLLSVLLLSIKLGYTFVLKAISPLKSHNTTACRKTGN